MGSYYWNNLLLLKLVDRMNMEYSGRELKSKAETYSNEELRKFIKDSARMNLRNSEVEEIRYVLSYM